MLELSAVVKYIDLNTAGTLFEARTWATGYMVLHSLSLPFLDLPLPFLDLPLPCLDLPLPCLDLPLPFLDLPLPSGAAL